QPDGSPQFTSRCAGPNLRPRQSTHRGKSEETSMSTRLVRAGILASILAAALPAAASAQGPKVWRHGVISLKSDAGFVMMPMQHAFASKRGLKIDTVQLKDGALALKALIAGEVDSIDGGAGEGIIAAMRGADVKIAGCHWPGLPHALFVRGNINTVQDL